FFLNELMKDLYKNEIIYFDDDLGVWRLDSNKINDVTMSDSVIHYLMNKMRALPEEVQRILALGASIGHLFDWKMLLLISEADNRVLAQSLIQAIREDIILPLNDQYHVMVGLLEELGEDLGKLDIHFAFQHDKLQQALYQLIDLETRKKLHLKIGRLLLHQLSPEDVEEKIVDIAGNLNKGLEFIFRKDEIDRIIEINLQSARKVKDAFGYDTAFEFLKVALSLLPLDSWTTDYRRTLDIYRLYSECAYLTHQLEAAEQASAVLVEHVEDRMELASVYERQANHYTYLGMMKESMEAGKRGLKCLGIKVPRNVSKASVLLELMKVKVALRGKTIQGLLAGPEMKDERIKLMMRLLVSFIPPAFISGQQNLFGWVVLKQAYLSARYGNGPVSAGAYTGYAILLSGLGDLKGARDFGQLAVSINEKFNDVQWRSLVFVLYTLFSHSWSHSWDTLEAWYTKAIDSSLKSGDLLYLAHAYYYRNLWNPSMEIERYLQESRRALTLIENTGYLEALATARLSRQKFLSLSGELDNLLSFDDATFSEADYLKQLTDANYYSGIAIYYVAKIQLSFTYEEYTLGLEYMEQANQFIGTLAGSAFMEEFTLYSYLNLTASYNNLSLKDKLKARLRMSKEMAKMKKWAAHCPVNFAQQMYIMKAEGARIKGSYEAAEAFYNLAIETSAQGSFIRYKALANELAAKFYYSRGRIEIAAYFFRQASYYYSVWGAMGKVNQLEGKYGVLQGFLNRTAGLPDKNPTATSSSDNIDIHAILMASEAITREIGLDPLLEALMEIVIVNAGAERGCIVMNANSTMLVEGEYNPDEDIITVRKYEDYSLYEHYPKSIVQKAATNRETLIYNDASSEIASTEDVYITRHRPKSLLCMPLMNQNKVTAIIYLENNVVTGAFTQERLKMIDLLSREMVYSLEKASLYKDLERLVAVRTEELEYKNEQLNKYIDIVDKNVMIVQTDLHGIITDVSEEFCKSSGYGKNELMGRVHGFLEAVDSSDRESQFRDFEISTIQVTVWKGELVQQSKDGKAVWLDIAVEPVADQEEMTGYTFIGHNITDKKRIEQNSITDELTGLYNRRYFKDVLWREVKRAARNEDCLTFILLDIDHYKKFNDTYGHYEGDHVLNKIGVTIDGQLRRATDYAFRLGGEEFGILYSGADPEQSFGFAEKIRKSIEALEIPHESSEHSRYVTVSVGLAVVATKDNQLNEEVIYKLADEALYRSKASGRNCSTINVL
ncbi:MAG: hypothetical protein K0R67_2143, partial [Paenibacillus sp.]|nr:hypothetical protein [Paenibacillus sp.]